MTKKTEGKKIARFIVIIPSIFLVPWLVVSVIMVVLSVTQSVEYDSMAVFKWSALAFWPLLMLAVAAGGYVDYRGRKEFDIT